MDTNTRLALARSGIASTIKTFTEREFAAPRVAGTPGTITMPSRGRAPSGPARMVGGPSPAPFPIPGVGVGAGAGLLLGAAGVAGAVIPRILPKVLPLIRKIAPFVAAGTAGYAVSEAGEPGVALGPPLGPGGGIEPSIGPLWRFPWGAPPDLPREWIAYSWNTGTAEFYRLIDGRIAVQNKKGVWKIYRPAKHLVISKNPRTRTLIKAEKRLNKIIKGLARMSPGLKLAKR